MAPFDWADPFRLEDQLTDEERMIRDAAHGFAQGTLQPRVIGAFRDEIDRIDAQLGTFAGRIRRDDWPAQARYLAAGDMAGFEQRFGKIS
jgi:glutaryl-CoA dehydrogenase